MVLIRRSNQVAPCALCGTPEGQAKFFGARPIRRSGLPFGIDGHLCATCFRGAREGEPVEAKTPAKIGRFTRRRIARRLALFYAIRERARVGASIFGARHDIRGAARA